MASSAEGRQAQRRDQIRGRLLHAVDTLTGGGESYANVTIERLVNAAGISRATFYIYFDGKGDLLRAWFSETLEELHSACRWWLALDAGSTQADLRDALWRIIVTYRAHMTLMTAINDEATQDSSLRDRLGAAVERTVAAVTTHLERGQSEGWVDSELLAAETAAWLVWLIERGLSQIVPGADEAQLERLTDTLAQMGWQTLYAGAGSRS